jgi:hypothetical protein
MAFGQQSFDLAVQREHLLDEGAAEVEQVHVESVDALELEKTIDGLFLEVPGQERGDRVLVGREAAALDARLETDRGAQPRQASGG